MIVYGARCQWWNYKEAVGIHPRSGLPCCPVCFGMLFEMDVQKWYELVDQYDLDNPGYADKVKWARGKHFATPADCDAAWASYCKDSL